MPENVNTSALVIDGANQGDASDNRETMIKIDHVSMVFNMASEQLNNLKEYAIKLAKRELFFEGFKALDDISFEVKKGDVFGIMGTNGSGKSTLLKIVAGVLEPSEGTCKINGSIAPLIELGAGFDMDLTARENIYLNGALLGYSKKFIDEHFDEIVEFAEVEKFLDMPLKNYSSGMVARIAFAIATVIVPEILIVDEVLSVGDFMFQKKCEDRINQLIEEHGVTVLIVSHSNEQIARLCNKAIWIEKGHTRLLGDAEEVCRVYGAIGGRAGSAVAEQEILKVLTSAKKENTALRKEIIAGEGAANVNLDLIRRAYNNDSKVVVLACDISHTNAIMANGIAAKYNAPILPLGKDQTHKETEWFIDDISPEQIIVVDRGYIAREAFSKAYPQTYYSQAEYVGESKDMVEYSLELIEWGAKKKIWGQKAALMSFEDNLESLTASPLLYKEGMPVVMLRNSNDDWNRISQSLKSAGISELFIFGPTISQDADVFFKNDGYFVERIGGSDSSDPCFEIEQYVLESFKEVDELQISTKALPQWPHLLACSYYACKKNAPLLLHDNTNLDSIKNSLDAVKKSKCKSLLFINGTTPLNKTDIDLLSAANELV